VKAIVTKYIGASNTRPSYIKASAEGVASKNYTVESLWAGTAEGRHAEVARLFAEHRGWSARLASGGLPDGVSWAHCFLPKPTKLRIAQIVDRVWGDQLSPSITRDEVDEIRAVDPEHASRERSLFESAIRYIGLWDSIPTSGAFDRWWQPRRDRVFEELADELWKGVRRER
jgi:hypothetical protein